MSPAFAVRPRRAGALAQGYVSGPASGQIAPGRNPQSDGQVRDAGSNRASAVLIPGVGPTVACWATDGRQTLQGSGKPRRRRSRRTRPPPVAGSVQPLASGNRFVSSGSTYDPGRDIRNFSCGIGLRPKRDVGLHVTPSLSRRERRERSAGGVFFQILDHSGGVDDGSQRRLAFAQDSRSGNSVW